LEAAEAMKLSATDLLKNGVIDEIIPEPIGGAHRDKEQMVFLTKEVLKNNLNELNKFNRQEILDHRKTKFLKIGTQKSIFPTYDPEKFSLSKGSKIINYLSNFFSDKKKIYFSLIFILFTLLIFGLSFF
jgi:acetyl-CoA carboxylase carboxyl transferase subunit alpha